MRYNPLEFELKLTDSGQVGIFPEQALHWDWIADQLRRAASPMKVLNLFAYTGGSTLAAAAAGANVVHLDSARPSVQWARRNAKRSGLADAPIRWIVDDARTFLRREEKRQEHYDAIILDPPTYGHGPRAEAWKIEQDLPETLSRCGRLLARNGSFLLMTWHTPQIRREALAAEVESVIRAGRAPGRVESRELMLPSAAGRGLFSGNAVYWVRDDV